jgi:hypothetical protein
MKLWEEDFSLARKRSGPIRSKAEPFCIRQLSIIAQQPPSSSTLTVNDLPCECNRG